MSQKSTSITKGHWTTSDVEKLRDLYFSHTPVPEIASALNRSPGAVEIKAWKLGLSRQRKINHYFPEKNPWTDEELNTLREERGKGTSFREIEGIIGRNRNSVAQMAGELGLPRIRRQVIRNKDKREIINLFHGGLTAVELGRKFGVTSTTILKLIDSRRYGTKADLTDGEKDIIEERFAEGCTGSCIAHRISRSSTTVNAYIKKMELIRDETDTDAIIADLLEHGLTVTQICIKLSLPRQTILAAIKRNQQASTHYPGKQGEPSHA